MRSMSPTSHDRVRIVTRCRAPGRTCVHDRTQAVESSAGPRESRERGASLVVAIVVLLLLSGLAAWVLTMATVQHSTSASDVASARAYQAARAGLEWGAYQVLQNTAGGYCTGATDSGTLAALPGTLAVFTVTVACVRTTHREASAVPNVEMFTLVATACNQAPCPNPSPRASYVERQMTMTVAR